MLERSKKNVQLIALLTLLAGAILLADYYLPNHHQQGYALERQDATNTSANVRKGRHSSTNYFLFAGGDKFEVPYMAYRNVNVGDSFTITNTAVFKRPLIIAYREEGQIVLAKIGKLNNTGVWLLLVGALLVALIGLLVNHSVPVQYRTQLLSAVGAALALTGVVAIMYFM